ncbi:hypothetical protein D1AOALGA4SA_2630 [Olavius algarvensis Delta 1 endosymbiont]|nr:hypothetical protein D1AOALGA4SA_2630 [Olavius algarvensis Delta 1 endosymbiont]
MGEAERETDITKWLASAGVHELISKIAGQIAADLRKRHIVPYFQDRINQVNETRDDILASIESELALLILEDRSHLRRLVLSGDPNIARALRSRFINLCLDKARSPDRDPYRYLYKRAADILRESETIYTRRAPVKGLNFSVHPENRPIPPLTREDLASIPWPTGLVAVLNYEAINRKAALLDLADYFAKRVAAAWGNRRVWVALRDLINWIGLHVPLQHSGPEAAEPEASRPVESLPDTRTDPNETPVNADFIAKCAACASNILNDREKEVFYYRRCLGLSLKEIAVRMGYKTSSGPKHYLDRAEHRLRRFLRDKPGLAPPDYDERDFAIFRENLSMILKESLSQP